MIKLDLNGKSITSVSCNNDVDITANTLINGAGLGLYYGKNMLIESVTMSREGDACTVMLLCNYDDVYGLGERFDKVNRRGTDTTVAVIEKFCNQGEVSYCPTPFFFASSRDGGSAFGIYADTMAVSKFSFKENCITIRVIPNSEGALPPLYVFAGEPREIVSAFSKLTGETKLPPKWAFGIWSSANSWNKEADVDNLLKAMEDTHLPLNVVVLEAWSDECTFYIWNGDGRWKNPAAMIDRLHQKDIKLILWQIPVLKLLTPDLQSEQHDSDCNYAVENGLCVQNRDGKPYIIPEGNWFAGSVIPDFTNSKTREWWFSKRQYLLDMGVDGFKTDGGEFIYTDDAVFADGTTSIEMRNGYIKSYVKAYTDFIGEDRILFSRAGYTGQQSYPIQWAGDQQSTWAEFRHILTAGLSAGLSGVAFWSYDIGGFAGALPSIELYERSTQMAVFCPVMQWHSETSGGQFAELMPSAAGNNERSPWNMASVYDDAGLIERLRFHYNLRTNLLPYLYMQAMNAKNTGLPMMRHLVLEYPQDSSVADIDDEFMLGDLLIAPIIEAGQTSRRLYLPHGEWQDFYTGERLIGGQWHIVHCGGEHIPTFLRSGGVVALNLGQDLKLGSYVGNTLDSYKNLCFIVTKPSGNYHFTDDCGNDFSISWSDNSHQIHGKCGISVKLIS